MKILKIEFCFGCKYYRLTYDRKTDLHRYVCGHPDWRNRKNCYRIINKKLAVRGEIPGWCKLEDYKE